MKLMVKIAVLTLPILFFSPSSFAVPTKGHKIMISSTNRIASDVGKRIAQKGGNVVDVAVAVGLTLSVTDPYFASLGGGGFAMIKMGKKPIEALDFREMAPGKTHPKFYLNKEKNASRDGANAIGVPGFPAGLWAMHKKYGKLHWSQLFDEPIKLAKKGFPLNGQWVERTEWSKAKFNRAGLKYFMKKNKVSFKPGEILKQPQLAKALKEMRNRGTVPFYQGQIASDIAATIQKSGGVMTLGDLKTYKVRWLKPIITKYEGHKLYLMPPPSSGGIVLVSALKLIEKLEMKKQKPLSVAEIHLLAEILKVSFRGRVLLGDPDFHKNPISDLTNDKSMSDWAKKISLDKVLKLEPIDIAMNESNETTHFSVLDAKGNAVSLTVTLNGVYGSKVVSDKYGIALNNEMDDFTTRPGEPNLFGLIQGKGNYVQPGKRPLSSMSPTLVEKNGKVVMAVGAQGGPKIISGVLQTLYRSLTNGYDMDLAIQTPRIHHQFLPDVVFYNPDRFSPEIIDGLNKIGHQTKASPHKSKVYGVRKNDEGILEAAFDARNEGGASGI